jgi:hypothetical protein
MAKFKVAILEDDPIFLKELIDNLKRTELIDLVAWDTTSIGFIDKVNKARPDALILDIHLAGDSNTGIGVAQLLQLPVLFLSSHRRNYLEEIDSLKLLGTFPVDQLGKTPDTEKLKTMLTTFIPIVKDYQKTLEVKVKLKPKGRDASYFYLCDIAFVKSLKGTGNHIVFFVNRKPIETADSTFEEFRSKGFSEDKFYRFGKPYLLNIAHSAYKDDSISISHVGEDGKTHTYLIPVLADKRKEVRTLLTS